MSLRSRSTAIEHLESRMLFAFADLSGWVGTGNTTSPNNYTVAPPTSAGGTFQSRVATTSSLRDDTIGTALGFNTSFSMSGSITFNVPTSPIVDPVWFLGFYNNANGNHRAGIAAANATAGDNLRFQISATNTAGTGVTSTNLTSGSATNIPDNTYAFNFTYNGSTHVMNASVGEFSASYTYTYNGAADLNRFGFLQAATAANTATFTASISNINYTGETQVSGSPPAAPSGLTANAVSSSQINLAWTDNSNNETGFEIDRATNSTFTAGLTTTNVGAGVISHNATGLAASTQYWFRVRATNAAGDSANSNTATATTQAAGGTTFYIDDTGLDTNPGTLALPWKTMNKAIQSAPANSTVFMRAGNYPQQVSSTPRTGKVTFIRYQSEVPSIDGIAFDDVTDVRMEGLKFVDVVQFKDAEDIEVVNNKATGSAPYFGGGIIFYGINNGLVEGNNIHHIDDTNAIITRSYNINFPSPENQIRHWTTSNLTIRNNTVRNVTDGDAMHVEVATNVLIEKNDVNLYGPGDDNLHSDGLQLVEVSDSTITGNIFGPNGRGMLLMPYDGYSTLSSNNTFSNNITAGGDFNLRLNRAPNTKIISNTLYGTSGSQFGGLDIGSAGNTGLVLKNNLIKVLNVGAGATFADRSHNLITNIYGSTRTTGEIAGAPTFVSVANRDFRLTSISPGRNAGTSGFTGYVALDRDGALRDTPNPDMGAYEFLD